MEIGDELSKDELIHEYNPDLRPEQNKTGIQFALDLLSFKAGLGTKYYEFSGGSVVTATQYSGDRQDLMKNAKKYRDNVNEFISGILKASLLLGRLVLKEKVTEDCIITVTNKDGLLVSDEEIREQYRQEYNMGLISKTTYLMKINNWTEEEAREELAKIDEENRIKAVEE
jgi:A118 family predicted phage portal protein